MVIPQLAYERGCYGLTVQDKKTRHSTKTPALGWLIDASSTLDAVEKRVTDFVTNMPAGHQDCCAHVLNFTSLPHFACRGMVLQVLSTEAIGNSLTHSSASAGLPSSLSKVFDLFVIHDLWLVWASLSSTSFQLFASFFVMIPLLCTAPVYMTLCWGIVLPMPGQTHPPQNPGVSHFHHLYQWCIFCCQDRLDGLWFHLLILVAFWSWWVLLHLI